MRSDRTRQCRRRLHRVLAFGLISAVGLCGPGFVGSVAAAAPAPVPSLDLNRYLGTWRQLAAIPQYFNLACARDTEANYSIESPGRVAVRNTCTTWVNTTNEITGTATVTDPDTNAQLNVAFPGGPHGQSDAATNYIVTAIDPEYSWAVVTNPGRTAGFVLSRTPVLAAPTWQQVRAAIVAAGQDACVYLTAPTTGGLANIVPVCTL